MADPDPSLAPESTDRGRSWLDRISSLLSGEPTSRSDLVELLRDAQADGLIDPDTLRMMEGAIAMSALSVGDIMIPRAQVVALPADASLEELMRQVVESGHSRFPVHGEDRDDVIGEVALQPTLLLGGLAEVHDPGVHAVLV